MASFGSMLLYWYHWSHNGRRIEVETDDDSIGGHFLHLLHGKKPPALWVKAMHTSLNLYAEHEFNASTFAARVIAGTGSDIYSAITGAIGALRGPKHGGANEFAYDVQNRYVTPEEAEADVRQRSRRSRSSSASATLSTRSPIRATPSSRASRAGSPNPPATPSSSASPSAWKP
jgi:2-methylcitrate synthase